MSEESEKEYYIPASFIREFKFLTPAQAMIIYLRDIEGVGIKGIANILGRHKHNTRIQYKKATNKIREMDKLLEEEDS